MFATTKITVADVFTKSKRSEVMSRIKSRGNLATELKFVRILKRERITGWRRHYKIKGRPDFAFLKQHLVIFIDGCFWHGCNRCYSEPKSNPEFWRRKITANRKRDKAVAFELRKSGWHVVRIWQHELKRKNEGRLLQRLQKIFGKVEKASER